MQYYKLLTKPTNDDKYHYEIYELQLRWEVDPISRQVKSSYINIVGRQLIFRKELYEDPTKDLGSEERFHVELHFSPGVNCCVQKDLPPGPGFRPHSRNNEQVSCH